MGRWDKSLTTPSGMTLSSSPRSVWDSTVLPPGKVCKDNEAVSLANVCYPDFVFCYLTYASPAPRQGASISPAIAITNAALLVPLMIT